jgi:hypothetical protein
MVMLLATTACAWTYPTYFGDTGLVLVPTAEVVPEATFDFAASYTTVRSDAVGDAKMFAVRADYGVAKNTEFFVFYSNPTDDNLNAIDGFGGGVKLNLVAEDRYSVIPSIGIGVRAIELKRLANLNMVETYAVTSKTIFGRGDMVEEGFAFRLHGGATFTNWSGDASASFIKPFGGVSYENVNGNAFAIDFMPAQKKNGMTYRENALSGVLRRQLSPGFSLEAGVTHPFGMGDNGAFYMGLIYHYFPISLSRY